MSPCVHSLYSVTEGSSLTRKQVNPAIKQQVRHVQHMNIQQPSLFLLQLTFTRSPPASRTQRNMERATTSSSNMFKSQFLITNTMICNKNLKRENSFQMLYMPLNWSWAALCDGCWWIIIFTWKHHSYIHRICLSCPHFPIFAVFFCGWVTADVRATQQQYREKLLIHD